MREICQRGVLRGLSVPTVISVSGGLLGYLPCIAWRDTHLI